VSWLNAIIYEMAVRMMLFKKFRVVISGCSLTGTLVGEKVDPERHQVAVEAKEATVTALRVQREQDSQWLAQCVVDV
jgi:SHS2 domain-containing protein